MIYIFITNDIEAADAGAACLKLTLNIGSQDRVAEVVAAQKIIIAQYV